MYKNAYNDYDIDRTRVASNLSIAVEYTIESHGWHSPCFCSNEELQESETKFTYLPLHPLIYDGKKVSLNYDPVTGEVDDNHLPLLKSLITERVDYINSAKVVARLPSPNYTHGDDR